MKKLNLIIGLLLLISGINAQQVKQAIPTQERIQNTQYKVLKTSKSQKIGETVIWSEDFGNGFPEGWENVNLAEDSILWEWTDQPIYGCYTPGRFPNEAETEGNGFMVINIDGYNSVPQYTNGDGTVFSDEYYIPDTYFQLPTINLSEYDGVLLEFYQWVRMWPLLHTIVMISNDYNLENSESAHWYEWYTFDLPISWDLSEFHRINISEVAAGKDSITIRFYTYGAPAFWWFIDDIKLLEQHANNIEILDSRFFYDWKKPEISDNSYLYGWLSGGNYTKIPKGQQKSFIEFRTLVENTGCRDQTNVTLNTEIYHKDLSTSNDSTLVYSVQSEAKLISANSIDSLYVHTDFIPVEWGFYNIYMKIKMDSIDVFPSDNNAYYSFEITDSVYSRTNDNINSIASTRHWIGGGMDGDGLGQLYKLNEDVTEVEALRFYFAPENDQFADLINAGNYKAIAKIFSWNEIEEDWNTVPLIVSEPYYPTMSDTGKFITLPFIKVGGAEVMEAGDYNVFLETHTGVDEGPNPDDNIGFYIGEDLTIEQPEFTQYLWIEESWGWVSRTNFKFDLIIAAEDWDTTSSSMEIDLEKTNDIILQQNYPNPAKEKTEINYVLNENINVKFVITDIAGKEIYSQNAGLQVIGKHRFGIDVSNFESGLYYYSIITDKQKITRKLTVLR